MQHFNKKQHDEAWRAKAKEEKDMKKYLRSVVRAHMGDAAYKYDVRIVLYPRIEGEE